MRVASRVTLQGSVQGCGVRPSVVRLAETQGVTGWVENAGDRVLMHVQGDVEQVQRFLTALPTALPALARLDHLHITDVVINDALSGFAIRQGAIAEALTEIPELPPDRGICAACLQELFDPESRRYQWPFISCSECGPRYSWLKALPFVRSNTTFSAFHACAACAEEYAQPSSRRFGMELIACEQCGPRLSFRDTAVEHTGNAAWKQVVSALRDGRIVALQSFSGFHLLARASNENAVKRLRQFKARTTKPLALLVESLGMLDDSVQASLLEHDWLAGSHRPIVLLQKNGLSKTNGSPQPYHLQYLHSVAPQNPRLGVMLPHNGLQQLIVSALGEAVVATSANRRGDPVAASVAEVLPWLGQGVDAICFHNIPIWQAQDDSVLSVLSDGPLFLRRARGFAHEALSVVPLSVGSADIDLAPVDNAVGEGAFLKNTFALRKGNRALLSQYIGDLDNVAVAERKAQVRSRLLRLCGISPTRIAIDAHPDIDAADYDGPVQPVFHHHAHAAALVAETHLTAPALIAAWDGIGYGGTDGGTDQWWGSEVFAVSDAPDATRSMPGNAMAASVCLLPRPWAGLQPFALPGGDKCSREPWRVMAALLIAAGIQSTQVLHFMQTQLSGIAAAPSVQRLVIESLASTVDFPQCTSMGRFLEGLSALILGATDNSFEAQAACRLEYAAGEVDLDVCKPFGLPRVMDSHGVARWQWQAMVVELWQALQGDIDRRWLARKVLQSMAEALLASCRAANIKTLGVSGGCFQNRFLLDYLRSRCRQQGIMLVRPQRLPPNDGAIAYGQIQLIVR